MTPRGPREEGEGRDRSWWEPTFGRAIGNGQMDPEAVASAELKPFIEEWRTHMTLTEISLRTQVSVRQLRRYQTGEIKFVTFAVADKIMTAFGLIPGVDVQVVPNPEYLHNYLRRGCSSD